MQPEFQIKPLKHWKSLLFPWARYKQERKGEKKKRERSFNEKKEDGKKRDEKEREELNISSPYKKAFLHSEASCQN